MKKKSFPIFILSLFSITFLSISFLAAAPQYREIIVSHTDENNILQLYYVKEDGLSRRQITNSMHGCLQPAVSPNGRKIVYLQMSGEGMSIWVSDIDGNNSKVLTKPGRNLIPSWFPDSKHIVWMNFKPGKTGSQIRRVTMLDRHHVQLFVSFSHQYEPPIHSSYRQSFCLFDDFVSL